MAYLPSTTRLLDDFEDWIDFDKIKPTPSKIIEVCDADWRGRYDFCFYVKYSPTDYSFYQVDGLFRLTPGCISYWKEI